MAGSSGFFSLRKVLGFLILLSIIGFVGFQSLWSLYVTNKTYTLSFPRGTVLTEDSISKINEAVQILKSDDSLNAKIIGHTAPQGDAQANKDLSLQRAEVVKSEFSYLGVPDSQLIVKGVGGTEPLARESGEADRSYYLRNSRVEVSVGRFFENPWDQYVTQQ